MRDFKVSFILGLLFLVGCGAAAPGEEIESISSEGQVVGMRTGKEGINAVIGDSCASADRQKICLGVHFVSYENPQGIAMADSTEAVKIVNTLNRLWGSCDILFQIDKYQSVNPVRYGLSFAEESQDEVDDIRRTFAVPSNTLLAVTTGPWDTAVNAWTTMPGEGPYGAVMESSSVRYGDGIIYAHEFGHYLGLDHVSDSADLMNPVIYTTSTKLEEKQCITARQTAAKYWSEMFR